MFDANERNKAHLVRVNLIACLRFMYRDNRERLQVLSSHIVPLMTNPLRYTQIIGLLLKFGWLRMLKDIWVGITCLPAIVWCSFIIAVSRHTTR